MLDRTAAPMSGAIGYTELLEPETHKFSNGITCYAINAGDQPVIKFELVLNASIWREKTAGATWFTAKMLMEGSRKKTSNEIASIFEFHGSQVEINPGFDNTSIVLYCLKNHFRKTLALLNEILNEAVFPEKELDNLKNIRRQQIRLNNEKNSFLTSKNIRKALYGSDHPYGRSLAENDIEQINVEVLKKLYSKGFLDLKEVFLSGNVGREEVTIVEEIFGSTSIKETNTTVGKFEVQQTEDVSLEREESMQSAIKLGWHIPNKGHQDHFKILITNEILGGYFGSRLMKNLREEKGLTYGVSSYPIFLKEASFLVIGAEVIADKTSLALQEINKEIELLKTQPVKDDELKTVTNYMAGSFLSKISTPFHLMEKFQSVNNHDLNYEYYEQYFEALKSISSKEILETANQYFDASKMSKSIAGKLP